MLREGTRSVIEAMHKEGTRRLILVSGSIVADDGEGPAMRYLVKPLARGTLLRHVDADMRGAEEQIRESGLDWTIVRPPRLTSEPGLGDLPHRRSTATCAAASRCPARTSPRTCSRSSRTRPPSTTTSASPVNGDQLPVSGLPRVQVGCCAASSARAAAAMSAPVLAWPASPSRPPATR